MQRRISLHLHLVAAVLPAFTAACSDPPADGAGPVDAPAAAVIDAPPAPDAPAANAECANGTHVIFLNRAGGTYRAGADDSSTNTSVLVPGEPLTLEPWDVGAETFEALRACVAHNYARYDVRVVDADPGDAEHVEVALAASLAPFEFPPGLIGVAPLPRECQPIRRAIVFYRATAYGTSPDGVAELCTAVSRSIADALGLDEIFDARSIMSWIFAPGPRSFLDEELPCGELEARGCRCGGVTQNSHQRLLTVLGACPG